MKREFLEQYYHETGNLVSIIHGISKHLTQLINAPVKNREQMTKLIKDLEHRTKQFDEFRLKFGTRVKRNGTQGTD